MVFGIEGLLAAGKIPVIQRGIAALGCDRDDGVEEIRVEGSRTVDLRFHQPARGRDRLRIARGQAERRGQGSPQFTAVVLCRRIEESSRFPASLASGGRHPRTDRTIATRRSSGRPRRLASPPSEPRHHGRRALVPESLSEIEERPDIVPAARARAPIRQTTT